jgi:hypothetical protein
VSEPDFPYPTWQREYQAALVETDGSRLLQRVHDAETAIFHRLQSLAKSSKDTAEGRVIADALNALRALKREKLGFPDWKEK